MKLDEITNYEIINVISTLVTILIARVSQTTKV